MSASFPLLPGEQVVMSSEKGILTLTTQRVRYDSAAWGTSSFISITLDSVASCGLSTQSYPVLLLLAALALLGAIAGRGDVTTQFLLVAAVLAGAYALTRRAVISIASKGGDAIVVPVRGMSRSAIIEFLGAVEREKLK